MRQVRAFIAPVVVGLVLPYLILGYEQQAALPAPAASAGWLAAGGLVGATGLALFLVTVRTFLRIGNGTIMPWDPTRRLVVAGPYRYVRNPMILSLIVALAGEALLFASPGIGLLAASFLIVNTVYFIYSEEPGLERRFGAEYAAYRQHVPRWIPRLTPWRPEGAPRSTRR